MIKKRYLYMNRQLLSSFKNIFTALLLTYIPSTQLVIAGNIRLPSLGGDSYSTIISPEDEILLGEAFMRSLRDQLTLIEDSTLNHYVKNLGQKLVGQSDDPTRDFEFFIVDDPTINAFAGPAGKIGIHSGLIDKAESEGELAAVLAHEISHITQRHLMRRVENQQGLPLSTIATVLATVVAASASPEAGQAIAATATGLSIQKQINFTRSNEQEADRIGMQILNDAGYSPKSMPSFFRKLQQANRNSGDSVPEYLRTHPLTISRIADAESRASQLTTPTNQEDKGVEFQLVKQLIKIHHFNNPDIALRYYHKLNKNRGDKYEYRYGYGVTLLESGDPQQALIQLQQLLKDTPDNPMLTISVAKTKLAIGDIDGALQSIKKTVRLYPAHIPLILAYTELLNRQKNYTEAVRLLEDGIKYHSNSPELQHQLAVIHARANHPVESHLAEAEYQFMRGETKNSLSQLDYADRALRESRGSELRSNKFILSSTIDALRVIYEEKEKLEDAATQN